MVKQKKRKKIFLNQGLIFILVVFVTLWIGACIYLSFILLFGEIKFPYVPEAIKIIFQKSENFIVPYLWRPYVP